jgi:hypothetical protein
MHLGSVVTAIGVVDNRSAVAGYPLDHHDMVPAHRNHP